jgi:chaperonin cofactor prefoldin
LTPPRRMQNQFLRKSNPLRNLVAQKQRASEIVREKQRMQLKSNLPSIIEDRVGEQIQKLETKLLTDFKELGQKAIEQSTAVLGEQLNERIDTLEKVSKLQTRTISTLRDSSRVADRKISAVVSQIEKSLGEAVPGGFTLEPLPSRSQTGAAAIHPQFQIPREPMEMVVAGSMDITEIVGKYGFCPHCTSTDIRRANRKGLFEGFLRLFFIAPFRCRACRHKFYRF